MSGTMSVIEVKVRDLNSDERASKSIFKLKGVKGVEIDMKQEKVIARGYHLKQRKVLEVIRGVGEATEPWSYDHIRWVILISSIYFTNHQSPSSHHNYESPGGIAPCHMHTFFRGRSLTGPTMAPMYTDEDATNYCSIM